MAATRDRDDHPLATGLANVVEGEAWQLAREDPAQAVRLVRAVQARLDRLADRLAAVPPPVRVPVPVPVPDQEAT